MSWTCPYQWSKPMLSVCRSSSEPQPAPLRVMLQCFKRLRQPASCQKTLSALLSLSVSILSVAWQIKHLYSVCMCVGVSEIRRLRGEVAESTAAAQTGLPSIFSPPPLLCERIKRTKKKGVTVTEKMLIKSSTNRYFWRFVLHYLLDL